MSYASAEALDSKLTEYGSLYAFDRDQSGSLGATESTYRSDCLAYADQLVNEALQPYMTSTFAMAQSNQWLADRALDIAVYKALTLGGRDAPESVKLFYDDAISRLEDVRAGDLRVPGLSYPNEDLPSGRRAGAPKAINVRRCFRRRWP